MLGASNARLNELEAENRRLRDELRTQTVRAEALAGIVRTQRAENDALVQQVNAMAAERRRAMQWAGQRPDGDLVTAAGALQRLCWN